MIPVNPAALALGWILDVLVGDPPFLARYHPIVWIGWLISFIERLLYSEKTSRVGGMLRGALLWLLVVGSTFGAALLILRYAVKEGPTTLLILEILLTWACLATGDLARQAGGVAWLAGEGRLLEARRALSMIVGRDTATLDADEIRRAAFETAAENSSDGIIAPLFYLTIGMAAGLGPALGLAYKAVNTLDSMVGYKNARYLYFGRFSARMDDLFNFIPARLTALVSTLLATLLFQSGARALKTVLLDAGKHSSPNSGYPEAAFAGAVGVRIGGSNFYGGIERASPTIGAGSPVDAGAMKRCLLLLWALSFISTLACAILLYAVSGGAVWFGG